MKMSEGDNLPIVDTPQGQAFAAGDVRAQENPDLTALQVLFVREHNYQVDRLHEEHPNWSGDRLYETAKAITTAEMVNITYSEFLPHLLGEDAIKPYHGYDPTVDPRITEEFAGAAFRFGHSIVSDEISAISNLGAFTSEQTLAESFFEDTGDLQRRRVPMACFGICRETWLICWTPTLSTACGTSWSILRTVWIWRRSISSAAMILGWVR